MASKAVLKAALIIFQRYEREYASYLEACEDDRRRGYRAHYCEHGTNQWTDYDNICGGCEEGDSMGYGEGRVIRRSYALRQASDWESDMRSLMTAYLDLHKRGLHEHFNLTAAFKQIEDRYGLNKLVQIDL